jgi:hypothetical protein
VSEAAVDLLSIVEDVFSEKTGDNLFHNACIFRETVKLAFKVFDVAVYGLANGRHIVSVAIRVAVGQRHDRITAHTDTIRES